MGVDREGEYRILLDTDWAELGGHGSRYYLILVLWYYVLSTAGQYHAGAQGPRGDLAHPGLEPRL